jgi:hypothetical protein
MKLGVWPRLGLVLTALWLAGGTYYYATTEQQEWLDLDAQVNVRCMYNSPSPMAMQECQRRSEESMTRLRDSNVWMNSFWFSLMLAVLAWIIVGVAYVATRWVRAGKNQA